MKWVTLQLQFIQGTSSSLKIRRDVLLQIPSLDQTYFFHISVDIDRCWQPNTFNRNILWLGANHEISRFDVGISIRDKTTLFLTRDLFLYKYIYIYNIQTSKFRSIIISGGVLIEHNFQPVGWKLCSINTPPQVIADLNLEVCTICYTSLKITIEPWLRWSLFCIFAKNTLLRRQCQMVILTLTI